MISLQRYQQLFRTQHFGDAFLASVIGRIPISITGLAILLFVQSKTGSFTLAGVISALYVLGLGVLAPILGRLIDRLGPKPVLSVSAAMYPAALIALVLLVSQSAPSFWIAACSAIAGAAMPPVTVCMRALYPQLLKDHDLLQAAYSLDSALIETIFILGPNLVAVFVAMHYTEGAVLFAAGCAALGSFVFLRSTAVKLWTLHVPELSRSLLGPLHNSPLLALFIATIMYSTAFGLFEVGVTGFATHRGAPAAAGVILGLASVGSALGVLIYGSHNWAVPVTRQLLLALAAMAGGILLLVPVDNMYWFAIVAIFGCAPMSVVLAATSTLISRLASRAMLAESFTWMATCLLAGISAGTAAGGVIVEHFSATPVFLSAAAATAIAGLIAGLTLPGRLLRPASEEI